MNGVRFLDAGETALVVEFGDGIENGLAARVRALDAAFGGKLPEGVRELVPTYRSLMIHYDPLRVDRATLVAAVDGALGGEGSVAEGRLWRVPACYDADFGEDLVHVADATGLSVAEVVKVHAGATYRLAMYGFAPGWAYLSGLPQALALPRRESPRDRIPGGSLIIAGGQALIAGGAMPSGWHILGRTPEAMFAPARDPAFLLEVGDRVTFDPVDLATFTHLQARADAGDAVAVRA